MAKPEQQPQQDADDGNLLKMMLAQVQDLDLTDPDQAEEERAAQDPRRLLVEGFEISKLFTIIEFALQQAGREGGLMDGFDMMSRQDTVKQINGAFLFIVKNAEGREQEFFVDMRKTGSFSTTRPAKPKPDVTIRVSDRDMVRLSTGEMNPQKAFLQGKLKVKGNIMLGLRCQNLLLREVTKLSRL